MKPYILPGPVTLIVVFPRRDMTSIEGSGPSGAVFVDLSGRRHRAVRLAGAFLALVGLTAGGLLAALALAGAPVDAPNLPFLRHAPQKAEGRSASHPGSTPGHVPVLASEVPASLPSAAGSSGTLAPAVLSATPTASVPSASPASVSPTYHARSQPVVNASVAPVVVPAPTPTARPTARPSATARGASTSAPGTVLRRSHP